MDGEEVRTKLRESGDDFSARIVIEEGTRAVGAFEEYRIMEVGKWGSSV